MFIISVWSVKHRGGNVRQVFPLSFGRASISSLYFTNTFLSNTGENEYFSLGGFIRIQPSLSVISWIVSLSWSLWCGSVHCSVERPDPRWNGANQWAQPDAERRRSGILLEYQSEDLVCHRNHTKIFVCCTCFLSDAFSIYSVRVTSTIFTRFTFYNIIFLPIHFSLAN